MIEFNNIYAGKRVLLTGHTGFKGSWLSLWLMRLGARATGWSVDVPTEPAIFDLARVSDAIEHRFGDVRDSEALIRLVGDVRPDMIFHLAAQPLVRRSYANPIETLTTNVTGTANLLEAVRVTGVRSSVVVVTSDKCYDNDGRREGYKESDRMGGHDPYSMSKGAAELVVDSWRNSYFMHDGAAARVASARAGNVIGGGDWAKDRIISDCIGALLSDEPIGLRNRLATRPWQHVLEPLSGYLLLGARLMAGERVDEGWNFGPDESNVRNVGQLVDELVGRWGSGASVQIAEAGAPHEAAALSLNIEKARRQLNWHPIWGFERTVAETVDWYKDWLRGADMRVVTMSQIDRYVADAAADAACWSEVGN